MLNDSQKTNGAEATNRIGEWPMRLKHEEDAGVLTYMVRDGSLFAAG